MAYHRTVHESRYDRQLRLWGSAGQYELEHAHAIVIGSTAVACELLKNLILPNIGTYTIVDDQLVQPVDVGSNYFCTEQHVGQYRCEVTAQQLQQLNTDCKYHTVKQSAASYIQHTLQSTLHNTAGRTVVVVTQFYDTDAVLQCADLCYEMNVPMIYVISVGLMSYVRLQVRELCIVESHPAGELYDLYLHPATATHCHALYKYPTEYADITDTALYDGHQHAHIPYIVILHYYLRMYMSLHNNQLPTSAEQRSAFRDLIQRGRWSVDEVNFDEALEQYTSAFSAPHVDPAVQQVLNDVAADQITATTDPYWYCIRAVRDFMQHDTHGCHCLPVSTHIPDMHCTSEQYVQIKQLYAQQAQADLQAVVQRVQSLLQQNQRPTDAIPLTYIEYVVRNIRHVRVYRTRSLRSEYTAVDVAHMQAQLEEYADMHDSSECSELQASNVDWYIALRAYIQFNEQHQRVPGSDDEQCEDDYHALCTYVQTFCTQYQLQHTVPVETLHEIVRYGGQQLHNVSAYCGGVGAQAALHLILQQYVPFNHTVLHNAIDCVTTVLTA